MRSKQHILPLLFAICLLGAILAILVFEKDVLFPTPALPDSSTTPPADQPSEPDDTDTPSEPDEPDGTDETDEPDEPDGSGDETDPPAPDTPTKPDPVVTIESYTAPIDLSDYTHAINYTFSSHQLVNKQNPLLPSASPGIVKTLPETLTLYKKDIQMEMTAATALEAMLLCMHADGITDVYVTSGYRSYSYQMDLVRTYVREEKQKDPTLTDEQALAIVRTYSAAAGYSEHQTGLCADLMTTGMTELDESFENTEAFEWLQKYACQFGFILRYPKDKTDITGYKYEPWHYRFVGREVAIEITEYGLTLEEYLAQ